MAASVCNALGTDKEVLTGKLIMIEEEHGSNGNFVLSCLMAEQVRHDNCVCLIAIHNTFSHYHNVGLKLGCNLQQLQDKGKVETVEFLKLFNAYFGSSKNFLLQNPEDIVKNLFLDIKTKIDKFLQIWKSVCLVIDDVSGLLSLGIPLKDVVSFIQYCRTLLETYSGVTLIVLIHRTEGDGELELISSSMAHVADVNVVIRGLKTGQSTDVSGVLEVFHRNLENSTGIKNWSEENLYHFKLLDRQVKIFAPGTSRYLT